MSEAVEADSIASSILGRFGLYIKRFAAANDTVILYAESRLRMDRTVL